MCNKIASLLNVASADIEVFLEVVEQQQNSAGGVKELAAVYLVQ